ncbi:MAG: thioredoxin family protein [Gemmatimonadaceae bacterium]
MTLSSRYCEASPFAHFLSTVEANADLWRSLARRVEVPDAAVDRVRALGSQWHLLVIAEDWCGDAVNTVPVLAKLADLAENLDLRVVSRETNPDLMDSHLASSGARAIPMVIAYDADFVEFGSWGSRPTPLQHWVQTTGAAMSKDDRYREIRRWYARDRGVTTLDEVIGILERRSSGR